MILATGGLAFGATSTRSNPASSARVRPSRRLTTPTFSPSWSINRIDVARICLLIRKSSLLLIVNALLLIKSSWLTQTLFPLRERTSYYHIFEGIVNRFQKVIVWELLSFALLQMQFHTRCCPNCSLWSSRPLFLNLLCLSFPPLPRWGRGLRWGWQQPNFH